MQRIRHGRLGALVLLAGLLAVVGPASAAFGKGSTGADLQTSGSASTGSPIAGQPFNYIFHVRNSGPQDASGATFTDQLPAGTTFSGASVAGARNACSAVDNGGAPLVTCPLGTLLKSGQATINVGVRAPQTSGTSSNTGTASSDV